MAQLRFNLDLIFRQESEDPAIVKVKDYIENHQRTGHMAEFWTHMAEYKHKSSIKLNCLSFTFPLIFSLTNETETVPSFNCPERLVKDIAIVEIYFGSPFVTKLQKDLTATFTDKLASMGTNNIGSNFKNSTH